MNRDKYVKAVTKKLKCSKKKKKEIERELEADIQIALENGEEWIQIKDRMGNPSSLAMEFNENLSKIELVSFKRIKRIKIICIIVIILGLIGTGIYFMLPKTYDIDNGSIFNKNTVVSQADKIIDLLNKNDYDIINNQYADSKMKIALKGTAIADAKEKVGTNWGEFKSFTSEYTAEVKQMGKKYAVAQITALYENRSVTYTISFDEDMKLAGLYMK